MTPAIVVERLSKKYQIGSLRRDMMLREQLVEFLRDPFGRRRKEASAIWALKDVSFTIESGEVVGIIGRNGAGKSTLLKILSRIVYPTTGRVKVEGRVGALLEVGTGFHEELTGRENVYLNGSILGMTKRQVDARFDEIVEFAGVNRFIDTPIKRYSSGMRLRLGFAVAAHLDPNVLIVDEVLAVGDAGFQKKCLAAMGDLRSGGRTVLFVSHSMAAVQNLCKRGIWIDDGQVREDGPAKLIIENYLSTFAAEADSLSDLTRVEQRGGSGEIRYTGIALLDADEEPKKIIRSGDALTLRFFYDARVDVLHPSFGFRLYTDLGTLVTDTATTFHGIHIPVLPTGSGHLDLRMDCVNLLPGRYNLSLWLTGIESRVVYDHLEHCTTFDVEAADVYNSGSTVDGRFGLVYFPQKWSLKGMNLGDARTPQFRISP
jgi:homopolymeric O-antigen transport system ATP-binding protein